jgi:histone acetyltransferase MYST1
MPPKSESVKKGKKADGGGPAKKMKKEKEDQQQEITMTIPRKKDKDAPEIEATTTVSKRDDDSPEDTMEEMEIDTESKQDEEDADAASKEEDTDSNASTGADKEVPSSNVSAASSKKSDKEKSVENASSETSTKTDQETTTSGALKPPKIETSLTEDSTLEKTAKAKSPLLIGTAADIHPYARASVIEVLHGVEDPSPDDWWSDDSDEESGEKSKSSVRLCDVIDRIAIGENKWRYYVHYKDFNRRMDEWVSQERIVSPPSIGNAKARAIKKEEERQKRKQQRLEERIAELNDVVDVSAPRASRRRTSMHIPSADAVAGAEGDSETPRRTRLQRKKSFLDDDNTVVASNQEKYGGAETPRPTTPAVSMAGEIGMISIPTSAATQTTTVGEHVVATIPAQELDEHEGLDEASLREHEEVTKVKNVAFVELGPHQMEAWYFSPLPKELLSEKGLIEVLCVCEFTFSLFSRKSELLRFQSRLPTHARHPPGNEIYRKGNLAMFEVDGFPERTYCQNLCYIAKLFLDHKTLYFDVDPFLFYVLCEVDNRGFHPVGYYSKEKYSDVGYNLACILTFPSHQRKGYGRFLIAFSYELSKKEEKVGSPEKPMSDLGQQAYKPYWASTIVDFLLNQSGGAPSMSIMDISKLTSIMAEDIVFTLNQLGILKIINGVYFVAAEENMLRTLAKKYPVKEPRVDPSKLHWTPFLTDVKRDKFSVHSKKPSVDGEDEVRRSGGFP